MQAVITEIIKTTDETVDAFASLSNEIVWIQMPSKEWH